ncbi:hypothetical protein CSHISOI_02625 [Colletotrichum shisoi]|uniref:Uncharacterized protein n=1 Tax=Colletotrichum shisoi TaxID=2078593 RepID=A0A5Q4C0J5_9PEZI|nr:hypothetical protein CSHISOI_02625 [Colletotrichum shisoi]
MVVTAPAAVAQDGWPDCADGNAVVSAVDDELYSVCVQGVTEAVGAVESAATEKAGGPSPGRGGLLAEKAVKRA